MATIFKLQFCTIVIACFYSRPSCGFKLPCNGVEVVTYGEPCHLPRYLPVTIEEPVEPVAKSILPEPCAYRPLKLNYRVISTEPIPCQPRAEYPIEVEVPPVPVPQTSEIIKPDPFRGKFYRYNIQAPPPPSVPITRTYDCDLQIPQPPLISKTILTPKPVKLLTGLTSKIDRVLIPACQMPSSTCCNNAYAA
ncbi:hypothetical protein PUN28_007265 [Cardiocondyla obscurior]|uniref:Uncharacterized protein n=1 Tax=Cardiocondyla obscurior TaxID=286306 RepID=A0AAW2G4P6_9HYME